MKPTRTRILTKDEIFEEVIRNAVLDAESHVWIATANLKDLHVPVGRSFVSALTVFEEMAGRGVRFRVIHGELPSRRFRDSLELCERLSGGGMELQICPRSHWKMAIVDGKKAYMGSANFTGAGLGARTPGRRNLELGIMTEDPEWVAELVGIYDRFWMGMECEGCSFAKRCPDPIRS